MQAHAPEAHVFGSCAGVRAALCYLQPRCSFHRRRLCANVVLRLHSGPLVNDYGSLSHPERAEALCFLFGQPLVRGV